MPTESSCGTYSIHSPFAVVISPRVGMGLAAPVSITESPSGSMPVVWTGIRTGVPATARAVRFSGRGGVFSASRGTIVM